MANPLDPIRLLGQPIQPVQPAGGSRHQHVDRTADEDVELVAPIARLEQAFPLGPWKGLPTI